PPAVAGALPGTPAAVDPAARADRRRLRRRRDRVRGGAARAGALAAAGGQGAGRLLRGSPARQRLRRGRRRRRAGAAGRALPVATDPLPGALHRLGAVVDGAAGDPGRGSAGGAGGGRVRIGELSRRSGVPLATIKFYLREGVLPPGERTAPNQARYGPEHLRRLRLVRALVEVGGLGVDAGKTVVAALAADLPLHEVLGAAHRALSAAPRLPDDEAAAAALADVGAFLAARGWQVAPDAPSRHDLARVLLALRGL